MVGGHYGVRNSIGMVGEAQGQGLIVFRVTFLACGSPSGCHPYVMTAWRRPSLEGQPKGLFMVATLYDCPPAKSTFQSNHLHS